MNEGHSELKKHFLKIFRHMKWADISILNLLEKQSIKEGKAAELISHIAIAEETWYKRIANEFYDNQFWKALSLEDCKRSIEQTNSKFVEYVHELTDEDFQKKISYKNSRGIYYTTSLEDIFTHMALHGTYHRGQIMQWMRNNGKNVAATDYVMFIREDENI
jgi:uncharacterized damage-inducible protein DinB